MDNYLKEKAEKLIKSMYKSVREKNAVEDVLDPDRVAEISPDEEGADKSNAMALSETGKSKKKKLEKCKDDPECGCDDETPADDEMEKKEVFVKSIMKNFQAISDAYLQKQELKKSRKKVKYSNPVKQEVRDKSDKKKRDKLGQELADKLAHDIEHEEPKRQKRLANKKKDFDRPRGVEDMAASEGKTPSKKDLKYPSKKDIERAKKKKVKIKQKGPEQRKKVRREEDSDKHPTDVKDPKFPSGKDLEYPEGKKMAASEGKKEGKWLGPEEDDKEFQDAVNKETDQRKKSTKTSRRIGPGGRKNKSKTPIKEKRKEERKRPYDKLPKRIPKVAQNKKKKK